MRYESILNGLDALLVSHAINIFYLTGFKGLSPTEREAFCLVTKENIYLLTDPRQDVKNIKVQIKLFTPEKKFTDQLLEIINSEHIKKLGFEENDMTVGECERLKMKLNSIAFVPTASRVGKVREIKEPIEIEKIRKACELSEDCLEEITKTIRVGQTEKEIGWKIEKWIRENGYELAFSPIVAIGANAAIPHYDTKKGNGKIVEGALLLIDMGVCFEHYNADITRMFAIGEVPTELQNVYEILKNAQEKTVQEIPRLAFGSARDDGGRAKNVDEFCRNILQKHNLPSYPHSTGHGVGLEVHESPNISSHSEQELVKGMVVTVEPGIYIPGKYGIRIEDTIAIGEGGVEILSKFPKTLQII